MNTTVNQNNPLDTAIEKSKNHRIAIPVNVNSNNLKTFDSS